MVMIWMIQGVTPITFRKPDPKGCPFRNEVQQGPQSSPESAASQQRKPRSEPPCCRAGPRAQVYHVLTMLYI